MKKTLKLTIGTLLATNIIAWACYIDAMSWAACTGQEAMPGNACIEILCDGSTVDNHRTCDSEGVAEQEGMQVCNAGAVTKHKISKSYTNAGGACVGIGVQFADDEYTKFIVTLDGESCTMPGSPYE